MLYGERTEGNPASKDFYANVKKIEAQRKKVENQLSALQKAIHKTEAKKTNEEKWLSLVKTNSALYEVDRALLEALVDRIEIGSRQIAEVAPTQDVRIYYKFNVAEIR